MLLDLFCSHARQTSLRVLRQHFYEFMLHLHTRIHEIQQERPVEVFANTLADEVDVICFDEFQITDIQDASILPRLFEIFFLCGVAIVLTSNTAPQLLYGGGLNRHVHLPPFVNLLAKYCTVLGLTGGRGAAPVDYRRRGEEAELGANADKTPLELYLCTSDRASRFDEKWTEAKQNDAVVSQELELRMGRRWTVDQTAGGVCKIGFQDLCGTDRSEADYLALVTAFHTIMLGSVRAFASFEDVDPLRRFVKFLDVAYDQRVRLVVEADAPLDDLFKGIRAELQAGGIDDLAWRTALYSADGKTGMAPSAVGTLCEAVRASDRAESRLREMRTRRYWNSCDINRSSGR